MTAGRRSHKFLVFTQGCVAMMHFAQGEKIAFVLPGLPSAGSAPSGALCQLRLSLFALFICLASERPAGGTGNCLDPVAPHIPSLFPAPSVGSRISRHWRGFGVGFGPFCIPLFLFPRFRNTPKRKISMHTLPRC